MSVNSVQGFELFFTATGEPIGKYYGESSKEAIASFKQDSSSYRLQHGVDVEWETPVRQRFDITARAVDY